MNEFFGPFELILNTDHVRQMEFNGDTVNYKRTIRRMKHITPVAKKYFHSLNVSNTWNILSIHKKLIGTCYNCNSEYHIVPNSPLPHNKDNIKQEKELCEASCENVSGRDKVGQHNNDRVSW